MTGTVESQNNTITALKTQLLNVTPNKTDTTNEKEPSSITPSTNTSTTTTGNTNSGSSVANTTTSETTSTGNKTSTNTSNTKNNVSNNENKKVSVATNSNSSGINDTYNSELYKTLSTVSATTLDEIPSSTTENDNNLMTSLSLTNVYIDSITTNGLSLSETTEGQRMNANQIFKYYVSNQIVFAELIGDNQIIEAVQNEDMELGLTALTSFDITPSDEQKDSISKGLGADVTVTDGEFEDNEMYLVVHESDVRDAFDVLVVKAEDGKLTFNVEDLSPVSIAKITTKDTLNVTPETDNTDFNFSNEANEIAEEETEQVNATIIVIFFVVVILIIVGIIFIFLKNKPSKKNVDDTFYDDDDSL